MTAVEAVVKAAPSMETPKLVKMLMNLPGELGERARANLLPGQLDFWSALDPPLLRSSWMPIPRISAGKPRSN